MNTTEVEIIDLPEMARNFPRLTEPNIIRDNLIQAITDNLSSTSDIVILEGPEGIGKTTLLAQFAKTHPHHTFSIFITGISTYGYDTATIADDLATQIGWALKKERFREDADSEPAQLLRSRIFELQRQAGYARETYYFVIDGIDEIPEEAVSVSKAIFNLLPLGISRFRFIISGKRESLRQHFPQIKQIASLQVVGFTIEETERYFRGYVTEHSDIATIFKLCKMIPGNMASLRRQLASGTPVGAMLEALPKSPPDWLRLEWQNVDLNYPDLKPALAILAFYRNEITLAELASLCSVEEDELRKQLSACTFIEVSRQNTIRFICDAFRRIASENLTKYKRATIESIVDRLLNSTDTSSPNPYLPNLLHQVGRHETLLSYLSNENIFALIQTCDSWMPLHRQFQLALSSASKLQIDGEMLRFSVNHSALSTLETADPWKSEIQAYLALEDYPAINAIAQQAVTKEDQLHLLAMIARSRRERKLEPDAAINEQIRGLYSVIQPDLLGPRGIDIATDLIHSQPELAVELIQKCVNPAEDFGNIDLAFTRISISSILSGSDGMEATHLDIKKRIQNPDLQKFLSTLSLYFGSYSAESVIDEVKNWDKPQDKILTLKGWLSKNPKALGTDVVISFLLETILKTTTYSPDAGLYAVVALPLVHISNIDFVRSIVGRLDGLKGSIEETGPTIEYFRLQVTIAEAEHSYNRQASFYRFQEMLYYGDAIKDYSTKLEAYAILVAALKTVDPDRNFDSQEPLMDLALHGLRLTAEQILEKTADHFEAIKPALQILSVTSLELGLGLVEKLNTIRRKDKAYKEIAVALSNQLPTEENVGAVLKAIKCINCPFWREDSTSRVIANYYNNRKTVSALPKSFLGFLHYISEMLTEDLRFRTYCRFLHLAMAFLESKDRDSIADSTTCIFDYWDKIECGWIRVRSGFIGVEILSKQHSVEAKQLLDKVEKLRTEIIFDSERSATSYIVAARLSIRGLSGLAKTRSYNTYDFDDLQDIIEKIPCAITQISSWSELAVRLHLHGDTQRCKEIVDLRIRPFLTKGFEFGSGSYFVALFNSAIALHCAHSTSAIRMIEHLPESYRDRALSDISLFLIRKEMPFDLFDDSTRTAGRVSYECFVDVFELLKCIGSDSIFSQTLVKLVEGIDPQKFRKTFNRVQIGEVKTKIRELINEKLPNPRYIKHEGYKIVCESVLLWLLGEKSGWKSLLDRARSLPNYADATLVLMDLAERMPKQAKSDAVVLFNEVKGRIPNIPFFEDRLHHYESLARSSVEIDRDFSKQCIQDAWREAMALSDSDAPDARRRLIDFAHRVDPGFASSLASETSEDPGRDFARNQAKERLKILKMREEIVNDGDKIPENGKDLEQCSEVAKIMLSGLNSGRVTTLPPDKTRSYIECSSQMDIRDTYSVISWVIENSIRRFSGDANAEGRIRPYFEGAKSAAMCCHRIASRKRAVTNSRKETALASTLDARLIRSGERDTAVSLIAEWATNAIDRICITDPYFSLEDLFIIRRIREMNSQIPIFILTSRKAQSDNGVETPWEDSFYAYWRLNVSDLDPGFVTIAVIGRGNSGEHPIHDRWCLSSNGGLRLGTSINSIGGLKASEISTISEGDVPTLLEEFDGWFLGRKIEANGERVRRSSFDL